MCQSKFAKEMRDLRKSILEGEVSVDRSIAATRAADLELRSEIASVYYQVKRMEKPESTFFNNRKKKQPAKILSKTSK